MASELRPIQITDRDRAVLAFTAEHQFVLAAQAAILLGVAVGTAGDRLRRLARAGYLLTQHELPRRPATHQITEPGLEIAGSFLAPPHAPNVSKHRHDAGLGWLMLAAQRGRFGPVQRVISERHMRSDDWRHRDRDWHYGVRLGGAGPRGQPRLHYPDMVLVTGSEHRVAFELELTGKGRRDRERILGGYAADRRIDAVIYLVDKPAVGAAVERTARQMGISHLVRVQRVKAAPRGAAGPPPRTAHRTRPAARRPEAVAR